MKAKLVRESLNHLNEYDPTWGGKILEQPKTKAERYQRWYNIVKKLYFFDDLAQKLIQGKKLEDLQELYNAVLEDNPQLTKEKLDSYIKYLQTNAKKDQNNEEPLYERVKK